MNEIFEQIDRDKLTRMLDIKKAYSEGRLTTAEARRQMQEQVGRVSPEEFAAAEQLIKEQDPDECRTEDVRTMLDIFEGLIPEEKESLPLGHPIDAYERENQELKKLLSKGDEMRGRSFIINEWLELMEEILAYKVHFARKQNQLYSILEHKGFDRPTTTMWPYDDEIKSEMNRAMAALQDDDIEAFRSAYDEMVVDLRDLMNKEELILYPTSLKLISDEEFEEMKSGDREIGFFRIEMPEWSRAESEPQVPTGDFMSELSSLLAKYGLGARRRPPKS